MCFRLREVNKVDFILTIVSQVYIFFYLPRQCLCNVIYKYQVMKML